MIIIIIPTESSYGYGRSCPLAGLDTEDDFAAVDCY